MSRPKKEDKLKGITVSLKPETIEKLNGISKNTYLAVSNIMRGLIEDGLKNEPNPNDDTTPIYDELSKIKGNTDSQQFRDLEHELLIQVITTIEICGSVNQETLFKLLNRTKKWNQIND